jgi:hypothetical protein
MSNMRQGSVRSRFRIERCPRRFIFVSSIVAALRRFYAVLIDFVDQLVSNGPQGEVRMKCTPRGAITLLAVILSFTLPLANGAYGSVTEREPASAALVEAWATDSHTSTIGLSLGFAVADFTGDTHPDLATVELSGFNSGNALYVIDIRFSEGGRHFLQLTAPFGGLLITPTDVTGDGSMDLVIRAAWSGVPVAVFLNDGRGYFSPIEPTAFTKTLRGPAPKQNFATQHFYVSATLVSPRSNTLSCQSKSVRNPQEQSGSSLSATSDAPFHIFPPFGSNRAPPAVA